MTKTAHYRTTFTAPVDIIFMTTDTFFVKGRQQWNRDFLCQPFFVACGALTPFAFVSVVIDVKIMVAHPASKDGFVQIMIKPYRMFMVFTELSAFNVHNTFLDLFIFGPCCGHS
jgi:hypothetical protein